MTLDVYLGRKTTTEQQQQYVLLLDFMFWDGLCKLKAFVQTLNCYLCMSCNMYIIFLNKYCLNQYVLYNLAQIYIEVKKSVVKRPTK